MDGKGSGTKTALGRNVRGNDCETKRRATRTTTREKNKNGGDSNNENKRKHLPIHQSTEWLVSKPREQVRAKRCNKLTWNELSPIVEKGKV